VLINQSLDGDNFYGAYHGLRAQGEGRDVAPAVR
jgi:hypothetical protein